MFSVRTWILIALFSAFGLFTIGLGTAEMWEHRPAGWPAVQVFAWKLPLKDSLGARLAQKTTDLDAANRTIQDLRNAIVKQNAGIGSVSDQGVKLQAATQAAVNTSIPIMAKATAAEAAIAAPVAGATDCDRARAIDDRFVTVLKGDN